MSFSEPYTLAEIRTWDLPELSFVLLPHKTWDVTSDNGGRNVLSIFLRVPELEGVCFKCISVFKVPSFTEIMCFYPGIIHESMVTTQG